MKQIKNLIKLQGIETEAAGISSTVNGVDKKLEELDLRVEEFRSTLENEQTLFDDLNKKYRSHEHEVKDNDSAISKNKEKLGIVKSNKEYQALLKGIDELKVKNSRIEDEMLEALDKIEDAEKNIALKKEEFNRFSEEMAGEKDAIAKEAEKGKKKLAELEAERDKIAGLVNAELMGRFNTIKERVGPVAIVPIINAVCKGCNVNIPPQMYNELLQNGDLKLCPHCQRMIYCEKS